MNPPKAKGPHERGTDREPKYREQSKLQATGELIAHARTELGRVISGQSQAVEEVLIAVLCQGHALLEGVPGIAKTLMVKTLGRLLGLGFQRVQATPDLMPADILGTTILRPGTDTFTFHAGPVFTDLLLVDEINRMPPRTQAALLECMEEAHGQPSRSMLGVGGVGYTRSRMNTAGIARSNQRFRFTELPSSGEEIRAAANALGSSKTTMLSGSGRQNPPSNGRSSGRFSSSIWQCTVSRTKKIQTGPRSSC